MLCLAGLCLGLSFASAAAGSEDWYTIEIAGQPAGWMVERHEERDGPGKERHLISESEMELSFTRGSTALTLSLAGRFVETGDGRPLEMGSRQVLGQTPLETTARFEGGQVELTTTQAGRVTRQTLPAPVGDWLPPAAAARFTRRQIAAGAERFSYRTVDPLLGPASFVIVHQRAGEETKVQLTSGKALATPWKQISEATSGVETLSYLDRQGRMVKSVTPMMGVELVLTLADRETALARHGAPELLVRTFVKPQRSIPSPRSSASARYRLSLAGGMPLELPATGSQAVEPENGAAIVRIRTGAPHRAVEEDLAPFLTASSYLGFRDPKITELRERALAKAGASPPERAEALRVFVHRYLVRKDLATGFATASEVAARASGDCTEHAVLLAALLRSAGIPSRVVAGLLYVEEFAGEREVFGYHMWTEALLDGAWIDLDAMGEAPFDATHIALAVSALNDGGDFPAMSARLAQTIGALRIEVLAVP